MTLHRLDASIRTAGSHSRDIADLVEQEWRRAHPGDPVTRRDLGRQPVSSAVWAHAIAAMGVPPEKQTTRQRKATTLAAAEADALIAADALLFAVPLYNWGVSQHFKTWVDLVIADGRLGAGAARGKPAALVVVRGGGYGPGTPKEGWDHATPWMRRVLQEVWNLDLHVVEAELTLVGVNPAMDGLEDLAAASRKAAEESARAFVSERIG